VVTAACVVPADSDAMAPDAAAVPADSAVPVDASTVPAVPVVTPVARGDDEIAVVGVSVPGQPRRIAALSPDFADNVNDPHDRHGAQVDQEFGIAGHRRPPFAKHADLQIGHR
jgi:hypothetical protein